MIEPSELQSVSESAPRVAVVIPAYRVRHSLAAVVDRIGNEVSDIIVVDDGCPQKSGAFLREQCRDSRVRILSHEVNLGVGAAMVSGYREALRIGADIIVKIDGDGQMDPQLLPRLIAPLLRGEADYVKGNRFVSLETLKAMPKLRLFGNSILSFLSKASSGYWNIMDPTNGYTAVHRDVLQLVALEKLDQRYFFESDMLFRLNTIRAVVKDVTMEARYDGEASSLSILGTIRDFPLKHLRCFVKRVLYTYYLRDFNPCSINILAGLAAILFGSIFGGWHWYHSAAAGVPTPTGTVMLAALPVILGFQMLLAAINFDLANVPKEPIHSAAKEAPRKRF